MKKYLIITLASLIGISACQKETESLSPRNKALKAGDYVSESTTNPANKGLMRSNQSVNPTVVNGILTFPCDDIFQGYMERLAHINDNWTQDDAAANNSVLILPNQALDNMENTLGYRSFRKKLETLRAANYANGVLNNENNTKILDPLLQSVFNENMELRIGNVLVKYDVPTQKFTGLELDEAGNMIRFIPDLGNEIANVPCSGGGTGGGGRGNGINADPCYEVGIITDDVINCNPKSRQFKIYFNDINRTGIAASGILKIEYGDGTSLLEIAAFTPLSYIRDPYIVNYLYPDAKDYTFTVSFFPLNTSCSNSSNFVRFNTAVYCNEDDFGKAHYFYMNSSQSKVMKCNVWQQNSLLLYRIGGETVYLEKNSNGTYQEKSVGTGNQIIARVKGRCYTNKCKDNFDFDKTDSRRNAKSVVVSEGVGQKFGTVTNEIFTQHAIIINGTNYNYTMYFDNHPCQ